MKKNVPAEQRWEWRLTPEGVVEYRPARQIKPVEEPRPPWTESSELEEWVEVVRQKGQPAGRYVLPVAAWTQQNTALGLVAEVCGLRKLHSPPWTMLAPNAVLHPQFGPMVTMCTDGTHVVLWTRPWAGTEWVMAHTGNILGPVTSTPTAVWEWLGRRATPESVKRTPAERKLSYAKALLEKILQQNKK